MSEKTSLYNNDIQDSETILNHVNDLKHELRELPKVNHFPVEVFPGKVQDIINATQVSLGFPTDFMGSAMLYAVSVAMGNTHRIEVKNSWVESAILYFSLVGPRGTIKSHPVSFALKPIEERDNINYQNFLNENREYDITSKLSKKERQEQGYDEPLKPFLEQILVSDFTPEALAVIHKNNIRGIGVYVDELASWFNNFNRYSKGSDEQFWLSLWSGKPIRISRVSSEPTYIQFPFISVIGTIQPGVLNELAKNRKENGFLDRILFVMPENLKKEYWSETELNPVFIENWNKIISNLLDLLTKYDETKKFHPEILKFSPEAKEILFKWQRKLTDESNESDNDELRGINAKIEIYVIRLSLCLEMLYFSCNESDKKTIGVRAVNGAIKLCEYYKNMAIKVHSVIKDDAPLNMLSDDKQTVYKELPQSFKTLEGVQIAESKEMSERTFKRFLNNRELFTKTSRGNYNKLH